MTEDAAAHHQGHESAGISSDCPIEGCLLPLPPVQDLLLTDAYPRIIAVFRFPAGQGCHTVALASISGQYHLPRAAPASSLFSLAR